MAREFPTRQLPANLLLIIEIGRYFAGEPLQLSRLSQPVPRVAACALRYARAIRPRCSGDLFCRLSSVLEADPLRRLEFELRLFQLPIPIRQRVDFAARRFPSLL